MSISQKRLDEIKDCYVWAKNDGWGSPTKDLFNNKSNFDEGFAVIEDDKGYNWIDTKGNILSDKRYIDTGDFHEGFAYFADDKGYNWIDTEGTKLSDKRYTFVGDFHEGFAWFMDDKGQSFVNYLGFEFRNNLDFRGATYEKDFEKNKPKLLNIEYNLFKNFPKGSIKYFILENICR